MPIRAVTLDLDDTLWPFAPIAARIQQALEDWLAAHAPATAARFDARDSLRFLQAVREEEPERAHDLAHLRRQGLRRMFTAAGDDPDLADGAFDVIGDARQQVDLYPDAEPALDRLAASFPLLAVTNGNADLERVGAARWFVGAVHAETAGVAKPDPQIFVIACERLGLPPGDVLHAGDDLVTDVGGALAAGLRAAWVHRDFEGEAPPGVLRARTLSELADELT